MFTGIVEQIGRIEQIESIGSNRNFWISAPFISELKIDQSVAHNGVCLTVVEFKDLNYCVTAIKETLDVTNLGSWKIGDAINLERCMPANGRFDGHVVQGHVDTRGKVIDVKNETGSWGFTFQLDQPHNGLIVHKGSICINGTSLTVTNVSELTFSVAIIPYTFEFTNFHSLEIDSLVNIEFDILGKYVQAAILSQNQD